MQEVAEVANLVELFFNCLDSHNNQYYKNKCLIINYFDHKSVEECEMGGQNKCSR